ncbi:hypothetical protein BOX15_Mlig022993g2 [Macrostomum lignano]|uniref:Protein kintoun n=1 Tax=Macrostomum lignano TaxID=282301 RepID=A0A267EQE7_9PLAT|nr:hypothetical protein BOX15_Mlig022993g2 [Macrostomum lignano]
MAHTMANSNKDNSGSSENVFKDLNMTPEEINRFTEAFKKEEFRKLFQEYVEELQNPEQRALYEKEIAQLEEERGMDVEFIHPTPGHVLKLKDASGKKVFINICTNDKIQVATMQRTEQNGKVGGNWSIPHSFAPPREDTDKSKQTCLVIDTVFHPDTYLMASRNAQFKKMIEDTAVQGAERNFQIKFANGGSAKRPKMTFKGLPQATVIRRKRPDYEDKQAQLETEPPNPFIQHYNNTQSGETPTAEGREFDLQDRAADGDNDSSPSTKNSPKQPKYEIKYSYQSDFGDFAYESPSDGSHTTALAGSSQSCPHSVQIVVELPGVTTAQAIDVDVDNRDLRVTSQQSSAAYNLQLRLPYPVTEDNGSAKFDRKSHRLTLILPCIAQQRPDEQSVSSAVAMPDPAPLIEELPDSSETASSVDVKPTDATNTTENATDSSSTSMKEEFRVGQLLPSTAIRCSQTDSHLTMLIDVKNVDPESIKEAEVSSGGCCWAVSFASVGSGGWRSDYSLAVMRSDFTVDFVQANQDNIVVRFVKTRKDQWLDQLILQAKPSPTSASDESIAKTVIQLPNMNKSLAGCLAQYSAAPSAASAASTSAAPSSLVVTELSGDRLTVRLDGVGEDVRDKPVAVTAQQQAPPPVQQQKQQQDQQSQSRVQGILKITRSPSLSSSDDLSSSLSSSQGQQQQNVLLNRSVSFSSHVESANYSTTATISAFHQTLRNRKKRQKQRETRRRRHNSDTTAPTIVEPLSASGSGSGSASGSGSGSGSTSGWRVARVRRSSEGCYANDDEFYNDGDENGEDFRIVDDNDEAEEAETVAAAAAVVASAAASPLSPPPPAQPSQKPPAAKATPKAVGQSSTVSVGSASQLTSSVIFELDDD